MNQEQAPNINLLDLLIIIWKGKFKVILISLIIVLAILYNYKNREIIYTATTQIQKISNYDQLKFEALNSYINSYYTDYFKTIETDVNNSNRKRKNKNNEIIIKPIKSTFQKINQEYLLNLFIQKLEEREILIEVIKKTNFLNKDDYTNSEKFENAVLKLAYSIDIFPDRKSKDGAIYWSIKFKVKDKKKWEKFLSSVNTELNQNLSEYINTVFKQFVQNQLSLKKYKIEDLDQQILNAIDGYKKETSYRLAFLKEQAQIARKLEISKNLNLNSSETRNLILENNVFEVLEKEVPYYMRGYQMIEKEIELISSREDIRPFVDGLEKLEEIRRNLLSNKQEKRIENLLRSIAETNTSNFAAEIMFLGTTYKSNQRPLSKTLIISILLGLIVGFFYVLIENSLRKRFKI